MPRAVAALGRDAVVLALLAAGSVGAAVAVHAADPPLPAMTRHAHPSGVWTFEAPTTWAVRELPGPPSRLEAAGDGQLVRFVYTPGEAGFDAVHVACMLERLRPEQETSPDIRYEYDFLGGKVGDYQILDSAFEVSYDEAVNGSHQWRQRNVTLVGKGHTLCVILHVPLKLWKRSKPTRAVQDAVLRSVHLP